MKMNKNLKMKTKLIISFLVIDAIVLFLLYTGYTTAATIINEADPQHYLSSCPCYRNYLWRNHGCDSKTAA